MLKNLVQTRLTLGEKFCHHYLTKRETEVLRGIVLGYTAKKIGKELQISFRTVEAYIDNLKFKLSCASKMDIAGTVIKSGLIHDLNILQQ